MDKTTRKKVSKETEDLSNTTNYENQTDIHRIYEIKLVIKKLTAKKSPDPNNLNGEFYKTFNEELTKLLHKLSQKWK